MNLRNLRICIMDSSNSGRQVAKKCDIHFTSFSQIIHGKRHMPHRVKENLEKIFPELKDD